MKEIAMRLLEANAVKLSPNNPFTWASGWKSPIYCNNRALMAFPEIREEIALEMVTLIDERYPDADAIIGVATGAVSWGVSLADRLYLPYGFVRSEKKDHGLKNQIDGFCKAGAKVVVIEDLVSTGKSSINVVKVLRDAGMEVQGMVAIFTYQFPVAEKAFAEAECELTTLTNYEELLSVAKERGDFDNQTEELLKKWRLTPETWGV